MDTNHLASTLVQNKSYQPKMSLSDLIVAAMIDDEFRELLFTDPAKALQIEPNKEPVNLSPEDTTLILSIQASSLVDLSRQILDHLNGNRTGNRHSDYQKSRANRSKMMP